MSLLEELNRLGVNTAEALDRVMGDESLYEMMLGMFVTAVKDHPISLDDFQGGDMDALIKHVHTLKGITGNLSITPLFQGYTEVLGLLRGGDVQTAKTKFEAMLPVQGQVLDCLQRHASAG